MLSNYEQPEQYFLGEPISVSKIMCGRSKRKLTPIIISIWNPIHKELLAEIDKAEKHIKYTFVGVEISGAIDHKNIIEGFTDFEAMTGVVSMVYSVVGGFAKRSNLNLYINNYAGQEWCKADLDEIFGGLEMDIL